MPATPPEPPALAGRHGLPRRLAGSRAAGGRPWGVIRPEGWLDRVLGRWSGVRVLVRYLVAVQVLVLAWGALLHLGGLAEALAGSGSVLDPRVPAWMGAYWVSLGALDPFAAALLALRRRVGLGASAAVLVTDAVVNGYAIHGLGVGVPWAWLGHLLVTALAVTVVATWPLVSPWLLRWSSPLSPAPTTH